METSTTTLETLTTDKSGLAAPVVIDLGRKSRKKIRSLRRGKQGSLMARVSEAIAQLKSEGVVGANAQPVVVVVRERSERPKGMMNLFP